MTNFHETLFPLDISLNAEGGPTRKTEIVTLVSGHEERNAQWANSRRSWNAGYGVKSMTDIEKVTAFFEARRGRLYGFRFRDPFDHQSSAYGKAATADDQLIGVGDGATLNFPLTKLYENGGASYLRRIAKPVAGTVRVAVDGVETASFTADETTGTVTFAVAPPAGAAITAGYLFDCPARFDTDALRINLAAFRAGDIPSIPLIEVLL
ncbi:MAG: TIGR02217 family protein [Parvularculaceae bacterium]